MEKKSQDLNINLKRGFQMFGEHVKRHSTSLDIRKMIIKIKITILNMLKLKLTISYADHHLEQILHSDMAARS